MMLLRFLQGHAFRFNSNMHVGLRMGFGEHGNELVRTVLDLLRGIVYVASNAIAETGVDLLVVVVNGEGDGKVAAIVEFDVGDDAPVRNVRKVHA